MQESSKDVSNLKQQAFGAALDNSGWSTIRIKMCQNPNTTPWVQFWVKAFVLPLELREGDQSGYPGVGEWRENGSGAYTYIHIYIITYIHTDFACIHTNTHTLNTLHTLHTLHSPNVMVLRVWLSRAKWVIVAVSLYKRQRLVMPHLTKLLFVFTGQTETMYPDVPRCKFGHGRDDGSLQLSLTIHTNKCKPRPTEWFRRTGQVAKLATNCVPRWFWIGTNYPPLSVIHKLSRVYLYNSDW